MLDVLQNNRGGTVKLLLSFTKGKGIQMLQIVTLKVE